MTCRSCDSVGGFVTPTDPSWSSFGEKGGAIRCSTPLGRQSRTRRSTDYLGGVGEGVFETMFGIDHERLVQGSEAILAGGGGVGESLFSAGIGGANTRRILDDLGAEADELFLPRGRKPSVNRAVGEYEAARREIRADALSSREWSEHARALEEAEKERQGLSRDLERLAAKRSRINRVVFAMPNLVRREGQLARIEELKDVVVLSGDFAERRREVITALEDAHRTLERGRSELEKLQGKAQDLTVPHMILEQTDKITNLHQRLGSHRKATRDRSKLQGQLDQLLADAELLLAELHPGVGLEEVDSLRPTAVQRGRVRELAAGHATLLDYQARTGTVLAGLENKLHETETALAGIEVPKDSAELARVVASAQRDGDLEGAHAKAVSNCDREWAQIEIELDRLSPRPATVGDLERAPLPLIETIDRFDADLQKLEAEEKLLGERLEAVRGDSAELALQLDELQRTGSVPTELELVKARDRRDQGWQLVRRAWLAAEDVIEETVLFDAEHDLADGYENAVHTADTVADRLRREADRVATMAELLARRDRAAGEMARLVSQHEETASRLGHLRSEWQALWSAAGIAAGSPREMRAWTARKDALLNRIESQRGYEVEARRLAGFIEGHRSAVSTVLDRLGEAPPEDHETLSVLLDRCRVLVSAMEESERRRSDLIKRRGELAQEINDARDECDASAAAVEQWQAHWAAVVSILGLAAESSPSEANTVLERLEKLFGKIDEARGVRGRIQGIERDADAFEADLEALVQAVAPELSGEPAEESAARLHTMLAQAKTNAANLKNYEEQIGDRETVCSEAEQTISTMTQRRAELCVEAGCAGPDELAEAERRSFGLCTARAELEALEEQLIEHGGVPVDQLVREAEGADPDDLRSQLDDLDRQINDIEGRRSELDQAIGSERQMLESMDGGDRSAMAAERAQSKLAEIRRDTHRYLRLRLASIILGREIELYRAQNQAPLLLRASELFARLTLGSFSGLVTAYDDADQPVLEGVRNGESRVAVAGMSAGTRDQLYLALRLASLEKYLSANEPLPFVVDDILVSFDDRRAAAALEVLAQLSKKTQVLFFTHHQRLVELAADAAGEVVVNHELRSGGLSQVDRM